MGAIRAVVPPEGASGEVAAAAEELRVLLERRYGGEVALGVPEGRRPKNAVYLEIGDGPPYRLGRQAFFIRREGLRLRITGGSARGLVNGVYGLCGRVLGARWYWAGEHGFEWAGPAPEKFPEIRWRHAPAFAMRWLQPMDAAYARRNRLVKGFRFGHALAGIFSPEVFEAHPEAFAEIRGRRRTPKGSGKYDPQPDFTEERTVEVAAEAALAHFRRNPESRTFSLSINDNVLFDDSAATREAVSPLAYFRGRPDYTGLVFRFMNAVARKVFEEGGAWRNSEGEKRYLTALAYYWTEAAPDFPVHPRVMPVLTSDRAQWHDPAYRAEDKALIERWSASGAERIGTWDYYFGAPYPYPRQFNEWVVASIRHLHACGVDVFFTQLPAIWAFDGAKPWLAARLLWAPESDAEALLREYYREFFGPAGPAMRRFYEAAEAWRNAHARTAEWIKFYKDEAGIALFPRSRLRVLRGHLEAAEAAVADGAERFRGRVGLVSEAFGFTEAYAAFHRARRAMVDAALSASAGAALPGGWPRQRDGSGATVALREAVAAFREARARYREVAGRVTGRPAHRQLRHFTRIKQSDPLPFALAVLAMAGDGRAVPPEYGELERLLRYLRAPEEAVRWTMRNAELAHGEGAPSPRDFLGPPLPEIPGWHFDFRASEHLAVEAAETGDAGRSGVRISGADMVSFFRDVPVAGDRRYVLALDARWRVSPDNRNQIKLTWRDRSGRRLRTDLPFQFPRGREASVRRLVFPLKAPPNAYELRIHVTVSRQYGGDFLELRRIGFGSVSRPR